MTTRSEPAQQPLEQHRIGWPSHGPVRRAIVYLHEGLGSVAGWQQFPSRLCASCSLPGLVYSRAGYGQSAPLPGPLTPDFLHQAATVELDCLLRDNGIEEVILVGHSDGASIAVIYAGQEQPMTARIVGLVAIAPHLFVEPVCIESIRALTEKVRQNPRRLAHLQAQHRDINALFDAWSSAWLSPEFQGLDLRAEAAAIRCPVLAVQGENDQYGTLAQIQQLASLAPNGTQHVMADCRHSPHIEAAERLLAVCAGFINDS